MPETPLLLQMAAGVQSIGVQKLPALAVDWTTTVFIDTVGVILAGLGEEGTQILLRTEGVGTANGGCLVLGTDIRTSALDAALINGAAAHALDYDDMASFAAIHPSTVIVPPLFALAERLDSSGKDIISAYVAGYEVGVRLSRALYYHHYEKGWHPTATLGTFCAAAAAARLMRLDVEKTANALALAASFSSGIKANFGTMAKPLHAGQSARNGLFAAELAAGGFTASPDALEGKQGYFEVFNGKGTYFPEKLMANWADPLEIVGTSAGIKVFPCCGSTHASIEMALKLRAEHGLQPDEIDRIDVEVHRRRIPHTDNPDPQTPLAGKFSQQYVVARALLDGEVKLRHFDEGQVTEPSVRSLTKRVHVGEHPDFNDSMPSHFGARVTVRTKDGRVLSRQADGDTWPTNFEPPSEELLFAKFEDCSSRTLPRDRIASLFESLQNLRDQPNLTSISRLLEIPSLKSHSSAAGRPKMAVGGEWIP